MRLVGDMGPNMGTTVNKIAYATNGRELNTASHTYSSSMPTGAIRKKTITLPPAFPTASEKGTRDSSFTHIPEPTPTPIHPHQYNTTTYILLHPHQSTNPHPSTTYTPTRPNTSTHPHQYNKDSKSSVLNSICRRTASISSSFLAGLNGVAAD
ncbi:hypothetical protein E2C01_086654 [Portunus trituberculatus]|uniref:Uncharacterized protein n=1 Tax=Portunus trituberculatus TaxID=210409 RepID=A0A5B7JF80_PORTR|nr:hypothetical protein [Portunus trituberculatus]